MNLHQLIDKTSAYIEKKLGLSATLYNETFWKNVLTARMTACQVDEKNYYKMLVESGQELDALTELLVVPETWFFRDCPVFSHLASWVKKESTQRQLVDPIIILSIPCATGEEPYSMVMAFSDVGISSSVYTVQAVDISRLAIDKAKIGAYTKNSFRGRDLAFRETYFERHHHHYQLHAQIKNQVVFYCDNILNPNFCLLQESFDVIFCRNVLIYLDEEAQRKVFQLFHKILKPGGYLIVGAAEAEAVRVNRMVSFECESVCIFKRFHEESAQVTKAQLEPPKKMLVPPAQKPLTFSEIHELADRGDFERAEMLCKTYLASEGSSSEAYFLLGLIAHARGKENEAESFFNKAVYLDPHHEEALVYLTLLAEKRGDLSQAQVYRKRARSV